MKRKELVVQFRIIGLTPPCGGVPMEVEGAYPPIETQADCADELALAEI